jgi:hypothetical protein
MHFDRQAGMTKLIVAFRSFAKAPKNLSYTTVPVSLSLYILSYVSTEFLLLVRYTYYKGYL